MTTSTITRTTIRFPLQVSVDYWWTDNAGRHRQGEGHSRDVSEGGAFVIAVDCPPPGASVELRMFFGAFADGTRALRMEVEGRVLRVEPSVVGTGNRGFAVLSDEAMLEEHDESCEDRSRARERA
jgi:hypothetical protein